MGHGRKDIRLPLGSHGVDGIDEREDEGTEEGYKESRCEDLDGLGLTYLL